MGDSLFEQPVIGMKNCWDFKWTQEAWRGREWFVVKNAKVHVSEGNILLPHVEMGVEAREQVANAKKELVDAPVTSTGHPLVKYADMFTHNFDLIAERKSVVYQLREVSKAAILAKFLVDNRVAMDNCWLRPEDEATVCKMDLPFNKKERFFYEILVSDGTIHEAHGGVLSSMMGLYGGVDLNIDAFDLSMPSRLSKSIKAPDYSAIYADPESMGNSTELSSLSTRELRRLIQDAGGQPPRGPVEKGDLIDQLLELRPPGAQEEEAKDGETPDGERLPYAAALEGDLHRLALPGETVRAILEVVRARVLGEAPAEAPAAGQGSFWDTLDAGSPEAVLFKAVYSSRLADRRSEGNLFVQPVRKESYIKSLQALVDEEKGVQEKRRTHFLSRDFVPTAPGPLFPSAWKPTFSMHFARGASVAAGGDAARGRHLVEVECSAKTAEVPGTQKPTFDRTTEDGVRFRVYRQGALEVRTIQQEEGEEERVGVVFEVGRPAPLADHHPVIKATEFVMSGEGHACARVGAGAPSRRGEQGLTEDQEDARNEGEQIPHRQLYHFFVVYETDLGDVILAEQHAGSAHFWEENPVDVEERYACARVLRVADASGSSTTVGQLRNQCQELAAATLSSRRYAQRAFELAGGVMLASSLLRPPEVNEGPVAPPPTGHVPGVRARMPQVLHGKSKAAGQPVRPR